MMPINPTSHSSQSIAGETGHSNGLDMSAHGLSRKTWVPSENVAEIRQLLADYFDGVDFTNLKTALSPEQFDAAVRLSTLGALDNHTWSDVLDQHVAAQHQAATAGEGVEECGGETSTASGDAPRSYRSQDNALDRAERGERGERGESRRAAVQPVRDVDNGSDAGTVTHRMNRIHTALRATTGAIFDAVPRATPAVLDVVCLGVSLPIAVFAIKQALEESHKPVHNDRVLFMKATLPAVMAVNSLRNLIKYGTDGRRV